jgi:hypothetical protein
LPNDSPITASAISMPSAAFAILSSSSLTMRIILPRLLAGRKQASRSDT